MINYKAILNQHFNYSSTLPATATSGSSSSADASSEMTNKYLEEAENDKTAKNSNKRNFDNNLTITIQYMNLS